MRSTQSTRTIGAMWHFDGTFCTLASPLESRLSIFGKWKLDQTWQVTKGKGSKVKFWIQEPIALRDEHRTRPSQYTMDYYDSTTRVISGWHVADARPESAWHAPFFYHRDTWRAKERVHRDTWWNPISAIGEGGLRHIPFHTNTHRQSRFASRFS